MNTASRLLSLLAATMIGGAVSGLVIAEPQQEQEKEISEERQDLHTTPAILALAAEDGKPDEQEDETQTEDKPTLHRCIVAMGDGGTSTDESKDETTTEEKPGMNDVSMVLGASAEKPEEQQDETGTEESPSLIG